MQKKVSAVVLSALLAVLAVAFAPCSAARAQEIAIFVDGRRVVPDVPAYIKNGRTMVPLRFVAEAFGFNVVWAGEGAEWPIQIYPVIPGVNDQLKGVASNFGFFGMRPGERNLVFRARELVDGGTVTTGALFAGNLGLPVAVGDVPAEIKDGRTFVPLRLLSEAFGCRVDWDGATWTVRVGRYDPDRIISYHPQLRDHYYQDLVPDGFFHCKREGDHFVRVLVPVCAPGARDYVENVEVILYFDGREAGRSVQPMVFGAPLPGYGAAAEFTVRWPKGEAHTLRAVVDPDGKHWDRDRANNVLEKTFSVD